MSQSFQPGLPRRSITILSLALGVALAVSAATNKNAALHLLISEVQPGSLSVEQRCMLVFDDRSFHTEIAQSVRGKVQDRKIYEGALSETDWTSLNSILDAKDFRELNVPPVGPVLIVHDTHPYTISVARKGGFQNMEFLNNNSLKPYEPQLKPLLKWWKAARANHADELNTDPDPRCTLNDRYSVINN
jgi:hypothetical protein